MSQLMQKLQKQSTLTYKAAVEDSIFFGSKECTTTPVPIINAQFSGELLGGFSSGLTVIAGPSKHFKSNLGLYAVRQFLKKHKDAICIFYDSEFGITPAYLKSFGIDPSRVLHCPIEHIEQLKFDMVAQLKEIDRKDKVIFFVDSVGNLASKKEVEDAENQKSVADMTRAKALKSLFRIVTPQFTTKDIPCIVINHTYESQGMFPTAVVSGGTGIYYSADTIFIIGRSQEKEGTDVVGYKFTINIEKSRFVKEKSKFPFFVYHDKSIDLFSGLIDLAMEYGSVIKPKVGWYSRVMSDADGEMIADKSWRMKETSSPEFWAPLLKDKKFHEFVSSKYKLANIQFDDASSIMDEMDSLLGDA